MAKILNFSDYFVPRPIIKEIELEYDGYSISAEVKGTSIRYYLTGFSTEDDAKEALYKIHKKTMESTKIIKK